MQYTIPQKRQKFKNTENINEEAGEVEEDKNITPKDSDSNNCLLYCIFHFFLFILAFLTLSVWLSYDSNECPLL